MSARETREERYERLADKLQLMLAEKYGNPNWSKDQEEKLVNLREWVDHLKLMIPQRK